MAAKTHPGARDARRAHRTPARSGSASGSRVGEDLGQDDAGIEYDRGIAPEVGVTWRYLLFSESDINTAKGSWEALKKLGGQPNLPASRVQRG
jgi:hypothetical protein